MSKDPAFLFYSQDFLTGVSDLTMKERGQYITLLCLQHQKGILTRKNIELSVGEISEDVLKKFTTDENGNFFNSRLRIESNKRKQHSNKQRDRSLSGWEKRKKKESRGKAAASAAALPLENEDENEDVIENKDESKNEIILPFETKNFKEWWSRWLEYRGEIGKKYKSPKSEQAALKQLSVFDEEFSIQLIERSIAGGYQGLVYKDTKEEYFKLNNNGKTDRVGAADIDEFFSRMGK